MLFLKCFKIINKTITITMIKPFVVIIFFLPQLLVNNIKEEEVLSFNFMNNKLRLSELAKRFC